jgi:MFS family permease
MAFGIAALTLGMTEGSSWHWQSGKALASFAFGLITLAYAVLRSRRHPEPAIDTGLWANRTYATANLVMLLYGMAQYSFSLATVLYLTGVWRFSELQAGLASTPGAISAAAASLGMGRLAPKLGGPRFVALSGLVLFGGCCTWLTVGLTTHVAFVSFWLPMCLLAGTGLGSTTMGLSASATLSAPPDKYASAGALNTTARQFGGALGIAATATIFMNTSSHPGGISPYSHVFLLCTSLVGLAFVISAIWLRYTNGRHNWRSCSWASSRALRGPTGRHQDEGRKTTSPPGRRGSSTSTSALRSASPSRVLRTRSRAIAAILVT